MWTTNLSSTEKCNAVRVVRSSNYYLFSVRYLRIGHPTYVSFYMTHLVRYMRLSFLVQHPQRRLKACDVCSEVRCTENDCGVAYIEVDACEMVSVNSKHSVSLYWSKYTRYACGDIKNACSEVRNAYSEVDNHAKNSIYFCTKESKRRKLDLQIFTVLLCEILTFAIRK